MKTSKAFTLIELIIGMTILIIGITAVLTLTLFTSLLNQENMLKVQALELSREGIEAMRNIRDSNWKNNHSFTGGTELWGENIEGKKNITVSPTFDPTLAPWKIKSIDPTNKEEYQLYMLEKGNVSLFTHEKAEDNHDSRFYRYIEIIPLDNDLKTTAEASEQIKVISHVFWENGKKEVTLETILTNWKKI